MKLFYSLMVILVASAIIILVLWPANRRQPYRQRQVMTANEIEFYGRLVLALPGLHVCPQVAMHALIEPTSTDSKARLIHFRRISQKVVDYAIFDAHWTIVALVELDDRTHIASRDAIRDGYTAAAGIGTLRYQSRSKPAPAQIQADIHAIQAAAAVVAAAASASSSGAPRT